MNTLLISPRKAAIDFSFQVTRYSYYHTVCAILYHNYKVEDYINSCFKVTEYRKTYENGILPSAAALDLDTLSIFDPMDVAMSLLLNLISMISTTQTMITMYCSLSIYVDLQSVLRKGIFGMKLRWNPKEY